MDSIRSLVGDVESGGGTLSVYEPSTPSVTDRLEAHFGPQRVDVELAESVGGNTPANFAVLHDDGDFVAASDLDVVESVLAFEAGLVRNPDLDADEYPAVLAHEDTTTFRSYSKPRMVLASREVEHAAHRGGAGELRAGFQRLSTMADQWSLYRRLADRGLDVHAYGVPDWEPPTDAAVEFHRTDDPEIRDSWFVAYDGDGDDARKAALIAVEGDDGTFRGFWTYDADLVDEFFAYLRRGRFLS